MWPPGTLSCFICKTIQNNLKHNNYKQSTEPCQFQKNKVYYLPANANIYSVPRYFWPVIRHACGGVF